MGALRRLLTIPVAAAAAASLIGAAKPAPDPSPVLARTATPHGWTIRQMASALAVFNASGNNPNDYPNTPFQILYFNPKTDSCANHNGGLDCVGSNSFSIQSGTDVFVPLFNVDNSPPVIGTFPSTHHAAVHYFFDPAEVGGRDFAITVDGVRTKIGWQYLAGPVATKPLPDGGGTHLMMLGAFLRTLRPGRHTVTITGGLFGKEIQPAVGLAFVAEDNTYTVRVA